MFVLLLLLYYICLNLGSYGKLNSVRGGREEEECLNYYSHCCDFSISWSCTLWSHLQKSGERSLGSTSPNPPPPPPTPQPSVRNDMKLQESLLGFKKSYSLNYGSFLGFLPPTTSTSGNCTKMKSEALKPSRSYVPSPQQKHFLVVECFSRDSENEGIPKTCDTRESSLFRRGASTRQGHSLHLSTGRALSDQKRGAKNWVPGSPQVYTGLQPDQGGINFHSHCSTSPLLIRVRVVSSQLDSPVLCQPSRPVTIQVSSSEHNPSCSKIVTSEQVTVQYSKIPSAIGSSKTSTLLNYLLPLLLASTTVGNSPTSNNPYKTLLQEYFEHCLGTQCLKPLLKVCVRLLHLLACASTLILDARSFNYSRGYSQVCVRLLHLLACASTLLLDARSFNYSRGYSQVCVRLLHLLACASTLLLDACSFNYSRGYSQVCVRLLHLLACASTLLLDARSFNYSRGYSQVCVRLLHLLACASTLLLDARSFNYSRGYSQVCVRLLHLLACASTLLLDARSFNYSRGY